MGGRTLVAAPAPASSNDAAVLVAPAIGEPPLHGDSVEITIVRRTLSTLDLGEVELLAGDLVTATASVAGKRWDPTIYYAIGGQIDFAVTSVAVPGQHIKAGRLRAVVTTGDKRSHVVPDTPTLIESGLTGFSAHAWWGIVAPAGIPKPIMDKMHGELTKAYNLPELRKQLTEQFGMDLVLSTPDVMTKFVTAEMTRWAKVVKDNAIHAD